MRLITKTIGQLTNEEYRYCYNANLDSSDKTTGRMRPDLVYYRSDPLTARDEDAKVVMLWDDAQSGAKRLIGWAMTFIEGREHIAFFWVKKPHRNKGYGTMLMKEIKKSNPKPYVYPWSDNSYGFFSKFEVDVPVDRTMRLVKKPIVC